MSVVVDARRLDRYLSGTTAKLLTGRAAFLDDVGKRVALSVRSNFDQSRSPEGQRWPALVREPERKPLIKTGALLGSVGHAVHPDYVAIGYEMPYGRFHQEGTRWIPMRRFLGFRDTDSEMLGAQTRRYAELAFAA